MKQLHLFSDSYNDVEEEDVEHHTYIVSHTEICEYSTYVQATNPAEALKRAINEPGKVNYNCVAWGNYPEVEEISISAPTGYSTITGVPQYSYLPEEELKVAVEEVKEEYGY